MKVLDLVLKRQWYDMIEHDEKPEEYRDITPHYFSLLVRTGETMLRRIESCENLQNPHSAARWNFENGYYNRRDYDAVRFHRAYTNTTMMREYRGLYIGRGNPDWGAPTDRDVFILALGRRIEQ